MIEFFDIFNDLVADAVCFSVEIGVLAARLWRVSVGLS